MRHGERLKRVRADMERLRREELDYLRRLNLPVVGDPICKNCDDYRSRHSDGMRAQCPFAPTTFAPQD